MILSVDNLFSWPAALWLCAGLSVVAHSWRRTRRIFSPWKRTFWRAFMISLAFTPTVLPAGGEFGQAIPVPAWYGLFVAARDLNMVALFAGTAPVILAGVILWTLGMAVHFLRNISRIS